MALAGAVVVFNSADRGRLPAQICRDFHQTCQLAAVLLKC